MLFSLIGTSYGGDGTTTFALPDLRGRVALSFGKSSAPSGSSYAPGQSGGTETVALTVANIPAHTHTASAAPAAATTATAGPSVILAAARDTSAAQADARYLPDGKPIAQVEALNAAEVAHAPGGGQPLDNMMPSFAVNYIIALIGIYPQAG